MAIDLIAGLRDGECRRNVAVHIFRIEVHSEAVAPLGLFDYDRHVRRTLMQTVEDANIVRERVLKSSTTNPALQRLQGRVLAGAEASEVITSYDRMHHRHSRS